MASSPRYSPREEATNFIEHCIAAATGGTSDGDLIVKAVRLIADAFWPDLLSGAIWTYNVETEETTVETPNAIYYIAVRAVSR